MTNNKNSKSILYFADIQGTQIIKKRSISRNISIAGNTKVLGICNALQLFDHKVIVYSLGSVAERTGKYHPPYKEFIPCTNNSQLCIYYGATVDNRLFRNVVGSIYAALTLPKIIKKSSVDTILLYNITLLTLTIAVISKLFKLKVFLEYEDSAKVTRASSFIKWRKIYKLHELIFQKIANGVLAANHNLIKSINVRNSYCLCGLLNDDLIVKSKVRKKTDRLQDAPIKLIYAGGLDESKGIDRFIAAIDRIDAPLKLIVCGHGVLANKIIELGRHSRHDIEFRGLVPREELIHLMLWADVGINPHRTDLHNGGSWPFKVVEYLGSCGTVFCSNSGKIPKNLEEKLFLYDGNDIDEISAAFQIFLDHWPKISEGAEDRRNWAINQFSAQGVGRHLNSLLSGRSTTAK